MFRNNSGSFASDDQALSVLRHALSKGFDHRLTDLERSMLYMPLMHSESLEVHDNLAMPTFKAAAEENPSSFQGSYNYEL